MTIEAMKVEGPIHVICQCDKCKAEKQERFFCERCGKRLSGGIHTCTPPAEAEKQEPVSFKDENGNVLMILDASKPIGYVYSIHGERIKGAAIDSKIPNGTPIYIHPQLKRQWVGLTDKERTQLVVESSGWNNPTSGFFSVARAIEAKLKEKNT
jgi:hypothetical protein